MTTSCTPASSVSRHPGQFAPCCLAIAFALACAPAQGLVDRTALILVPPLGPSYYPGAAWGDVDGDGWDDLYVTNYYGANHLFLNRPAGTVPVGGPTRQLVDSTPAVLMDPAGHGEGCVFADFDNDGDSDLYVVNAGGMPNRLFANLGGGAWANVSAGSGVDHAGIGEGCATADWDGDGDLDLFLLNYGATSAGELSRWYRNVGGLTFVDATPASLTLGPAPGGACAFADYDADGDLDLFVGNDGAANRLFQNNGTLGWANVTATVGGAALADTAGGCFGVRWLDHDRDGDLDLYVSNSATFSGSSATNRLFRNDPSPLLPGARVLTLVSSGAEDTGSGMAVTGGDIDRDGYEDLAIANFGTNKVYLGGPVGTLAPAFAPPPLAWFADPVGDTSSSATRCDFDHDGDLDVFFGGSTLFAFENRSVTTPAGLAVVPPRTVAVRFRGDRIAPFEVPRDGHGTRARLFVRSPVVTSTLGGTFGRALQQIDGGSGYAQDAPECFWAVPAPYDTPILDRLQVTWANGRSEQLAGLPAPSAATPNQRLVVHYPAGISSYGALAVTSVPLNRSSTNNEFPTAQVGAANFALAASGVPDGAVGILAVGFAPTSVPTPFGTLLVDPVLTLVALAVDGIVKWPLPLPASPAAAGAVIYAQCFVFEPSGAVRTSPGLAAVVQP
ncbi:MAG: VCBS repeat-containing protein [Planctomycetota bacterium]